MDAFLALALTSVAMLTLVARDAPAPPLRSDDVVSVFLVLLTTVPLAALRLQPVAVYAVMLAAGLVHTGLGYQTPLASTAAYLVALFVITLVEGYPQGIAAAVTSAMVSLVAIFVLSRAPVDVTTAVVTWVAFSTIWLLALLLKVYRESAREARQRAALFAADREARAQEAVADERARLARELHDVVGHALNVVVLQAGGAQRVLDTKPELAREALASIEAAGRQALADVERMLGILRSVQREGETMEAPPGVMRLPALVEQVTQAGLPTRLAVNGARADLPASVDLSAYRIVQEALTNSLKHAGRAKAAVRISYTPAALEVEVLDDGRATPSGDVALAGGRGIPGMRERVAVFGGRLEVGPRPEGGFRVWARLPLEETR